MTPEPDHKPNKKSLWTVSGAKAAFEGGRRPEASRIVEFLTSSPRGEWRLGLLLVAATMIAYLPVWHAGFIWDDDALLTNNPCIVGPLGFKAIWTSGAAIYFPLALSSFWLQHALWGLDPLPYHLVNIVLHAACALLLWRVLRWLQVRGAWLGAALWAFHPVQVESVAWIAELKNTQSCLFYLLAVWFFLKWRAGQTAGGRKGNEWNYALVWLWTALAILSKSSTVMLPVVLGLGWWWLEGRWRWRNGLRLIPFLLISAAASGWTVWEQKFHSKAVGPEWAQSLSERFIIAGKDIGFYLGKLLWPHPLIFVYPRWEIDGSRPGAYLPPVAVAVVLAVLWWCRHGGLRPVFFASAYFLISLFPVLDFFDAYFFRYSFVEDHLQYLASMGPLALAAAGIATAFGFFKRGKPFLEPALCGTLLLLLGVLTWRQCGMYTDLETLWRTTITRNPDCSMAHTSLGIILLKKGQIDQAISHHQEAIRLKPDYAAAHNNLGVALDEKGQIDEAIRQYLEAIRLEADQAMAHYNLGIAFGERGQIDEAIRQYQEAIRLQPDYALTHNNLGNTLLKKGQVDEAIRQYQEAIRLQPGYALVHNNLGTALDKKGQVDEAIRQYQEAIRLQPGYVEAHNNLGNTLLKKGQVDEAIRQYQEAIRLKFEDVEAHNNLGNTLLKKGQVDEAIRQYQEAIRLEPDYADAHYNLGAALGKKGQVDEAIRQYQEAIRLKPDYAMAHYNLGTALGKRGRVDEAITQFQEAIRLKPDHADAHYNLGIALGTKGQIDEAIRQYQEVIRLNVDHAMAHNNLGTALDEKGQIDEAIHQYQEAIRLKPEDADAHYNLGSALGKKGQIDEAIRQYQEAIRLKPRTPTSTTASVSPSARKGKSTRQSANIRKPSA